MARRINRITAEGAKKLKVTGYHPDGDGLYLQVSPAGTKSWIFRYMLAGRAREMGLGSFKIYSLADARRKASECRKLLDERKDPIAARNSARADALATATATVTFDQCAKKYIEAHKNSWRNDKHIAQWSSTLNTYASPQFGSLPVARIDTALVMKAIERIWQTKTETASRVRGRIESVLDWAAVHGYRSEDNPARWHGHLDKLLPKRSKVQKVKHHAALPYAQLPDFMVELGKRDGVAPKALEFIILTAVRVSEAVKARWGEIDFEARIWTIPSDRMKAGRVHRVPLTREASASLQSLPRKNQSDLIFPGWKAGKPLTGAACLQLLDAMGYGKFTTHGFRSSFRDWCAEQTNFPREIAEAALAHVIKDKTEAAYQRGDLLDRRRDLMQAWASYCKTSVRETARSGEEEAGISVSLADGRLSLM